MIKKINKNDARKSKFTSSFLVSNDEIAGDYGSTVMEDFYVKKATVYKYERWGDFCWSDDVDDVIEYFAEELCEEEGFRDLFNEEFDKAIEKYVEENIEHYEAIIISVS